MTATGQQGSNTNWIRVTSGASSNGQGRVSYNGDEEFSFRCPDRHADYRGMDVYGDAGRSECGIV